MKNRLIASAIIAFITFGWIFGTANATATLFSQQVGSSPVAGSVLQTNGVTSTWVATGTLGISGGGGNASTSFYVNGVLFTTTSSINFSQGSNITVTTTTVNGVLTYLITGVAASGTFTTVTGVSPIVVNQVGSAATTSCPTCQVTTSTIIASGTTLTGPSFNFGTSTTITPYVSGTAVYWLVPANTYYPYSGNPSNFLTVAPATSTLIAGGTATGPAITLATSTSAGVWTIVCGTATCTFTIPPAHDAFYSPSTTIPTNFVTSLNGTGGVYNLYVGSGLSIATGTSSSTITNTITNNNQLTNGAGYITGNQSITWTGTGDVTGSGSGATSISVALTTKKIQGNNVTSTTPTDHQLFVWVAANSDWEPANIAAGTGIGIATSTSSSTSFTISNTGVTSAIAGGCVTVSNATGTVTLGSTCSTAVGANPTAQVGTSAVNGSSANFMRADGAPAINQAATFSFSALGNTTSTGNISAATINVSGQSTLASVSSTNAQTSGTLVAGGATTLNSSLTQSGGVVSEASTTINGSATTTGNAYTLTHNNAVVTSTATTSSTQINWALGNDQVIQLQTSTALTYTGCYQGEYGSLDIYQDSTGSRTITSWPSTGSCQVNWLNGEGAPTLPTTASTDFLISVEFKNTSFVTSTIIGRQMYVSSTPSMYFTE